MRIYREPRPTFGPAVWQVVDDASDVPELTPRKVQSATQQGYSGEEVQSGVAAVLEKEFEGENFTGCIVESHHIGVYEVCAFVTGCSRWSATRAQMIKTKLRRVLGSTQFEFFLIHARLDER